MIESLYIHIPFCNSICTYCSFTKRIYNEEIAHNYILNVLKDLDRVSEKSLSTIFIGGGTPSSLSNLDLELLLKKLKPLLKETQTTIIIDLTKIEIIKNLVITTITNLIIEINKVEIKDLAAIDH